jgi:aarF domain-containing kinase
MDVSLIFQIPKVHYELSTDMVLTMEFCEGGQITDLDYFNEHKLDRHKVFGFLFQLQPNQPAPTTEIRNPLQVCRMLGKLYSEMIFEHGYIHSDPHPGNVLVRRHNGEEQIVLLDHGLYTVGDLDMNCMDHCTTFIFLPDAA